MNNDVFAEKVRNISTEKVKY